MWAAIGAAAAVVTGVIVVAAGSAGSSGWRELSPPPLSPREYPAGFWTGEEVILVGGSDAPPCSPNAELRGALGAAARRRGGVRPGSGRLARDRGCPGRASPGRSRSSSARPRTSGSPASRRGQRRRAPSSPTGSAGTAGRSSPCRPTPPGTSSSRPATALSPCPAATRKASAPILSTTRAIRVERAAGRPVLARVRPRRCLGRGGAPALRSRADGGPERRSPAAGGGLRLRVGLLARARRPRSGLRAQARRSPGSSGPSAPDEAEGGTTEVAAGDDCSSSSARAGRGTTADGEARLPRLALVARLLSSRSPLLHHYATVVPPLRVHAARAESRETCPRC